MSIIKKQDFYSLWSIQGFNRKALTDLRQFNTFPKLTDKEVSDILSRNNLSPYGEYLYIDYNTKRCCVIKPDRLFSWL